jgi:hypothetical protein
MRWIKDQIILTGSVYLQSPTEYHSIDFFINEQKKSFDVIERRAYEPSVVCIYKQESLLHEKQPIRFKIKFQNQSYEYILEKEDYPNYDIVSMTVFKDDYRLMEFYVDYYSNMGVEAFFFYYNGKMDESLFDFIQNSKYPIHITEWNYQYWTNPHHLLKFCSGHHAQPMAIMDSLYWLKNISKYCLYNDFDEYIFSQHHLGNLTKDNPSVNHFSFICHWSKLGKDLVNYKNIRDKFSEKELVMGQSCGMERRKSMIKLSDIKIMRIHFPSDYHHQREISKYIDGFHHICNFEEMDRRYFIEKNVAQNNYCMQTSQDILLDKYLYTENINIVDRYFCNDPTKLEFIKPFIQNEIWSEVNTPIQGFEMSGKIQNWFVFRRTNSVKVGFQYFWSTFLSSTERDFLLHLLSLIPNALYETDIEKCDIIYHSYFGNKFDKKDTNKKYIFFSGEKYEIPTEQYTVSLCQKKESESDKIVCYPFFFTVLHSYSPRYDLVWKENKDNKIPSEFCAFIIGNPSCQIRNFFFEYLCKKYKNVHSYGKVLNNVGYMADFPYNDPRQLQLLSKHKFVICFENTKTDDYYITEKLLIAKASGCIPIYWGTKKCLELFDKNAFLYLEEESKDAMDKLIEKIKLLDNHSTLYLQIRNKKLLTEDASIRFSKDSQLKKIHSYLL